MASIAAKIKRATIFFINKPPKRHMKYQYTTDDYNTEQENNQDVIQQIINSFYLHNLLKIKLCYLNKNIKEIQRLCLRRALNKE